jgi:hypothetical protein
MALEEDDSGSIGDGSSRVARIAQTEPPGPRIGKSMASGARRQHAIEHVEHDHPRLPDGKPAPYAIGQIPLERRPGASVHRAAT